MKNNFSCFAKVFVGIGFYGGLGPQVNETYENAGYGAGGISWLGQTQLNRTNTLEINQRRNSYSNWNSLQGRVEEKTMNFDFNIDFVSKQVS